ncbi:hypothetical protein EJ06DRAFT_501305 [Trichodelitschia bisporula]|uniref:CENP-V/GFA domain-containing protein n=1 Tax=Trichodelitschia bisporula TaxID=703511 RepID=A0A6G1HIC3_9PEZI|nr:hypothetical protein EJ06DRAFT_501305 [Trichodelitschia bisporula]
MDPTYTAHCHCGANVVKFTPPKELTDSEAKTIVCNCSICARNGYMLQFVGPDGFEWEKGGFEGLSEYKFGKEAISHYFCPTCGTSLAVSGMGMYGFNVRAVDGVDLDKITLKPYDGAAL